MAAGDRYLPLSPTPTCPVSRLSRFLPGRARCFYEASTAANDAYSLLPATLRLADAFCSVELS